MNIRLGRGRSLLAVFAALCFAVQGDTRLLGQEKEKNSLDALFNGIPADLKTKVRDNPVRIDRVEDWLQEHLRGKGKTVELTFAVKDIYYPKRGDDGTYIILLKLEPAKALALGDEWTVTIGNGSRLNTDLAFAGVSALDAETFVNTKSVLVQGKVTIVRMLGGSGSSGGPKSGFAPPRIFVGVEDVQVNGKIWAAHKSPDGPFGKGKKGGS